MPAANYPDQMHLHGHLTHSSTEKRRMQKNLDNANVRVVAETKLSDRKKVFVHTHCGSLLFPILFIKMMV